MKVINEMRVAVEADGNGFKAVVDEDVNGTKAIPFVAVTKNANGEFEYASFGGGGNVDVPDGSITTAKFATDAKAPRAGVADSASAVAWGNVSGKPATFAPATHTHAIGDVTGLQAAIDGKAATSHTHTIANITGLQGALDGKQAKVTGLTALPADADLVAAVAKINEIIAKF